MERAKVIPLQRPIEPQTQEEPKQKRSKGDGSVFLRGRIWWYSYTRGKTRVCRSSKSTKKSVAAALLRKELGELELGVIPSRSFERTTYEDLEKCVVLNYELRGKSKPRTKNLQQFFYGMKAQAIDSVRIMEYIKQRLNAGASPATVNRETSTLHFMFTLAARQVPPLIDRPPFIERLQEARPKQGFFETKDYERILALMPDYLKGVVQWAFHTGWRRGQVLGLQWSMINQRERLVSVPPELCKNREDHVICLDDDLLSIVREQKALKMKGCRLVFHRDGRKLHDFRSVWNKACRELKLGFGYRIRAADVQKWKTQGLKAGPTLHDFRRTACKNLIKSGLDMSYAMKITGHKTRSVFDRYHIIQPKDLAEQQRKYSEYLKKERDKLQNKQQ